MPFIAGMVENGFTFKDFDYKVSQKQRVFDAISKRAHHMYRNKYLVNGEWKSLETLTLLTGDPIKSIGARLRELRKRVNGKHNIEVLLFNGTYYYRLKGK